jgi:hypothetical protein
MLNQQNFPGCVEDNTDNSGGETSLEEAIQPSGGNGYPGSTADCAGGCTPQLMLILHGFVWKASTDCLHRQPV